MAVLKKAGLVISMTEENHCYENGLAERVNGILKDEFGLDEEFADLQAAQRAVRQAIDTYNTRRPHFALKLRTPEQVHQKVAGDPPAGPAVSFGRHGDLRKGQRNCTKQFLCFQTFPSVVSLSLAGCSPAWPASVWEDRLKVTNLPGQAKKSIKPNQ